MSKANENKLPSESAFYGGHLGIEGDHDLDNYENPILRIARSSSPALYFSDF